MPAKTTHRTARQFSIDGAGRTHRGERDLGRTTAEAALPLPFELVRRRVSDVVDRAMLADEHARQSASVNGTEKEVAGAA